jgi:hypothetical protein
MAQVEIEWIAPVVRICSSDLLDPTGLDGLHEHHCHAMAELQAVARLRRLGRIVQQRSRKQIGLIVPCDQQRLLHVERVALIPLDHA